MSNIKVQCIDQAISFLNTPVISSGNVNYDTITFDFCSRWDGYAKTAIFYRTKDEVYYRLLENDTCLIPNEVLGEKGVIYIGVFGTLDDKTITSQVLRYRIDEGAITENLKPSDPTPDIYDQIISRYNDYDQRLAYFEERFNTSVGDAEKLGGQLPEYYATAQSVKDIEEGTTPAGNALKLNGLSAEEFARSKDFHRSDTYTYMESGSGEELYRLQLQSGEVKVWKSTDSGATWTDLGSVSDGGNADTVDGKHANDFLTRLYETKEGIDLLATADDDTICPNYHATRFRAYKPTNAPFEDGDFFIEVQKVSNSWTKIVATTVRKNYEYTNVKCSGTWQGWKCGAFVDEVLLRDGSVPMLETLEIAKSGSGSTTRLINHNGVSYLRNRIDADNYIDLVITKDGLMVAKKANGVESGYNLLHKGNMASYVLPLDGSVPMSGNLDIQSGDFSTIALKTSDVATKGKGVVEVGVNHVNLRTMNDDGTTNYRSVVLSNSKRTSLENALQFTETVDSVTNYYTVLHTGNSQKVTITDSADDVPSEMSGLWAY